MKQQHFKLSKLSELMTFNQYNELNEWNLGQHDFPDRFKVQLNKKYIASKKANLLTRIVVDYLTMKGYFVERTGNTGQYRDNTKIVTDVIGMKRKIGSAGWAKGSGTKGTSDLKAIINGKFYAIEIKYGKDRQSEAQKIYQANVEKSGGIYVIVSHLNDLLQCF